MNASLNYLIYSIYLQDNETIPINECIVQYISWEIISLLDLKYGVTLLMAIPCFYLTRIIVL